MDNLIIKILLIGDNYTQKDELINYYINGFSHEDNISSINDIYKSKIIEIKGINICLELYNIFGQEKYIHLSNSYINGADGIMFIYDITNKDSFNKVKNWIREIESNNNKKKKILIGNNCHLEEIRIISKEKMEILASKYNIKGFEVSSKLGTNVSESFEMLVSLIIDDIPKKELIKYSSSKIENKEVNKNNIKIEKKEIKNKKLEIKKEKKEKKEIKIKDEYKKEKKEIKINNNKDELKNEKYKDKIDNNKDELKNEKNKDKINNKSNINKKINKETNDEINTNPFSNIPLDKLIKSYSNISLNKYINC